MVNQHARLHILLFIPDFMNSHHSQDFHRINDYTYLQDIQMKMIINSNLDV